MAQTFVIVIVSVNWGGHISDVGNTIPRKSVPGENAFSMKYIPGGTHLLVLVFFCNVFSS